MDKPVKSRKKRRRTFADLYGIWKGKSNLSYEEINEAEITVKDDWIGAGADQKLDRPEEP